MSNPSEAKELLRQTVGAQRFAVLSTLSNQQPYSNLVAFAVSDDLRQIIFATNRDTQKYRNILSNNKIALLIDNRSNSQSDFTRALAITVIGIAKELNGEGRDDLVQSYLNKHTSLKEFLNTPDTAIINVQVTDYILARFEGANRIRIDEIS
jgi:nitroimidazol reductase NimA-like FMN-containing flavoprotein (pyridoxamine 5'-phosphate oxidase superfamily)